MLPGMGGTFVASPEEKAALRKGVLVAERYRIIDVLGVGGVGAVYEAEHVGLGRRVALKILLPKYVENERMLSRFLQEARAAAAIGHPGIVEAYDVGRDDDMVFIAMELLEGEELQERIVRDFPLTEKFVLRVGIDLADAVSAAHEHGIIHRDLKPQNIFLANTRNQKDVVKVLDLGLAKLTRSDEEDSLITRSGEVFGTPMYMAPEHLRSARDVDGRADIYAMGAILYQALTGTTPFDASTFAELVLKITSESPVEISLLRPGVSPPLARLVEKAMSKDREDRFGSASEIRDSLSTCLQDESEIETSPTMDDIDDSELSARPAPSASSSAAVTRASPAPATPVVESDEAAHGEDEPETAREAEPSPGEVDSRTSRAGPTNRPVIAGAVIIALALVGGTLFWMSQRAGASDPREVGGLSASQPVASTKANDTDPSASPVAEETSSIELRIEAIPSEAKVFVDRAMAPDNPFAGRFPRDGLAHSVRVEAVGYESWAQMVVFDRSQQLEVELTKIQGQEVDVSRSLQRVTPKQPPRTKTKPPPASKEVFPADEDPWTE